MNDAYLTFNVSLDVNTSFEIKNSSDFYYYYDYYTLSDLYFQMLRINRIYIMIIVIIISLVGNTLTALVLSRKKYRDNTTAVYLLSLDFGLDNNFEDDVKLVKNV